MEVDYDAGKYAVGDALGGRAEMVIKEGRGRAEAALQTRVGWGRVGVRETRVGRVGSAAGCAGVQHTLEGARVLGRDRGALADVEAVARDGEGGGVVGEMERGRRFRLQEQNKSAEAATKGAKPLVPH